MGFFSKIFGSAENYPPLEPSNPATARLQEIEPHLTKLHAELGEKLEVVFAAENAYVFIGKPPKKFGLAWIEAGDLYNFKYLVDKKSYLPHHLQELNEKLRAAYLEHAAVPRYSATVGDQDLAVVPPDEPLGVAVAAIIQAAAA